MHACEAAHIEAWTNGNTCLWSLVVHQLQLVRRQADCDLDRLACAEVSYGLEGQRLLMNVGAYCVLDHHISGDCDLVISAGHNLDVKGRTDEHFLEGVHALARGSLRHQILRGASCWPVCGGVHVYDQSKERHRKDNVPKFQHQRTT